MEVAGLGDPVAEHHYSIAPRSGEGEARPVRTEGGSNPPGESSIIRLGGRGPRTYYTFFSWQRTLSKSLL